MGHPRYLAHQEMIAARFEGASRLQWLVDAESGAQHLAAFRALLGHGSSLSHRHLRSEEVVYVVHGSGAAWVDGQRHYLTPGAALLIPEGAAHQLECQSAILEVVGANALGAQSEPSRLLGTDQTTQSANPGNVRKTSAIWEEMKVAPTLLGERSFRLLIGAHVGCWRLAQFTGLIPPGRAPLHAHPYEEATYVLSGEGRLWINDDPIGELRPGSMAFLPIGIPHSLENTHVGEPLKVLGMLSPADSPAAKISTGGTAQ